MVMGRDFAKAIIRDSSDEARLIYGESILLKRISGSSPGNPAQGISPTFSFLLTNLIYRPISSGQGECLAARCLKYAVDVGSSLRQ